MGSWDDTFTEQLTHDIFIEQQHLNRLVLTAPCPAAQDRSQMRPPPEGSEALHAPFAWRLWDRRPHSWSDKGLSAYPVDSTSYNCW